MTDILLQTTLINTAAAAGGAALVWTATRCGLRASWLHALWIAVLLRLVMPPLWPVAVLPSAQEKGPIPSAARAAPSWNGDWASDPSASGAASRVVRFSSEWPDGMGRIVSTEESRVPAFSQAWWQRLWREVKAWPWTTIALAAWAVGAVAWWTLAWARLRRFHRLLQQGERKASPLCDTVGVPLRLIGARISPCLWAFGGRAFIAFPRALYQTLPASERELILRHELAHYHRRDHWVRWVEFVVLGLQWWNPLAWWIAARLREAEEAACDARVAAGAPDARRAYAAALVRTTDFLGADDAWPAPRLASGAGSLAPLKRRLRAIMENTPPPRRTGWAALLLLIGSAALVATPVPESPEKKGSPEIPPKEPASVVQSTDEALSQSPDKVSAGKNPPQPEKLTIKGEGMKYNLEAKRAEYSGGVFVGFDEVQIWADSGQVTVASDGPQNFRLKLKGPNLLFTHRYKKREVILTCDTLVYDSAQGLVQARGQMEMAVPILARGESCEFSPTTGKMTGKFSTSALSEQEQNEMRLKLLSIKDKYPKLNAKLSVDSSAGNNGAEEKEMQEAYLNAYIQVTDAEKHEREKSPEQALQIYRQALAAFEAIAKQWPDWEPKMVQARISLTKGKIESLLSEKNPDRKKDEARHFPASDETKAAQQVVQGFFQAGTVDERLKYVRFGEAMRSHMEAWHRKHPLKTEVMESDDLTDALTKLLTPNGIKLTVVTMKGKESNGYQFFAVEKGADGLKLDWETAVGWQPIALEDFQKGETQGPQPFRVHAGKGDYYNGPFAEDDGWLCVDLTYPGDAEFKVYGYARRDSETGKRLQTLTEAQSASLIVEVSRPAGAAKNQAIIERVLHEEWFLKDGPLPVKE